MVGGAVPIIHSFRWLAGVGTPVIGHTRSWLFAPPRWTASPWPLRLRLAQGRFHFQLTSGVTFDGVHQVLTMAEGGNNNGGVAAASEAVAAEAANAEDYLTTPLSEPDVAAKLSTMASDLKHVLELNNVARAVIAQLGKKHVKTCALSVHPHGGLDAHVCQCVACGCDAAVL